MVFVYLCLIVIIIYYFIKHSEQKRTILTQEFDLALMKNKEVLSKKSRAELNRMEAECRTKYIEYRIGVIKQWNKQNPNNQIEFQHVNLDNSISSVETDTKADFLIAEIDLSFIAKYRAIVDLLSEKKRIRK